MKLQWKFGNSCTTRPLQCSICQNLGKVGCTDFRNCHPFDSFALFLLGKPNARLMALSISSYLCPKLPSKKPYCQTSYRSIITNSIPNGPKDSYRVKSQRKKQIPCINTYMWKPEKWYRWTYLQSNRDTGIENKSTGTTWGKRRWDELGDWGWHMYTTMYKIDT